VVESLYANLPANGSELVLFDLNRNTKFGPLLRTVFASATERILPPPPRNWHLTIIANTQDDPEVMERVTAAGEAAERVRGLGVVYPRDVFSLSHIALPFPVDDPLYGSQPNPAEDFGVALGSLAAHGEVGVLIVSLDTLARLTWNPFFPYMLTRIEETIGPALTRQRDLWRSVPGAAISPLFCRCARSRPRPYLTPVKSPRANQAALGCC
jgi:hypothetical protein